jgi:two-component system, OmpR family, response regulator ChvI
MTTMLESRPSMVSQAPRIGTKPSATRHARVLVVDDDEEFRQSLAYSLMDHGFDAVTCASGPAALEYIGAGKSADLILLDWRMPGMNGLEVLRELRQRGAKTPVIFLTGLADEVFEEAALASGAVDFVGKSRRFSILLQRIDLIAEAQRPPVNPSQKPPPAQVRLGGLELRMDMNRAFWRGAAVDLTVTEFRMIARLALKAGEDISYRELYDLVHGANFRAGSGPEGFRTNVRTFIKRIRRKFRAIDGSFDAIQNYARFGYRWICS